MPRRFYSTLCFIGNHLQSLLLLAIRLFWGSGFFLAGIGKFGHLGAVINYFHSLGIPMAPFNAFLTASTETLCGACLVLGLASRFITLPLMCVMAVAFLTAENAALHAAFSDPQKFIHSTPFSFLFACVLIFVFGPGSFSLDRWMRIGRCN